jgi:hypothetical protein
MQRAFRSLILIAPSIRVSVTGKGGDRIIVDDPVLR